MDAAAAAKFLRETLIWSSHGGVLAGSSGNAQLGLRFDGAHSCWQWGPAADARQQTSPKRPLSGA
jgi:hypothetical protein